MKHALVSMWLHGKLRSPTLPRALCHFYILPAQVISGIFLNELDTIMVVQLRTSMMCSVTHDLTLGIHGEWQAEKLASALNLCKADTTT